MEFRVLQHLTYQPVGIKIETQQRFARQYFEELKGPESHESQAKTLSLHPKIVSATEWHAAREQHLAKEDWKDSPEGWPQTPPYAWWGVITTGMESEHVPAVHHYHSCHRYECDLDRRADRVRRAKA